MVCTGREILTTFKGGFSDNMPNYEKMTQVSKTLAGVAIDRHAMRTTAAATYQGKLDQLEDLSDDDLMFAPSTLHGFSLSDKLWRERP
jgi:hypothetical protein